MSITMITERMRDPLTTTLQDVETQNGATGVKTGKALAQAMRSSLDAEKTPGTDGMDTVTISEEGRAIQQRMAAGEQDGTEEDTAGMDIEERLGSKKAIHSGVAGNAEGEDSSAAARTIANIKKQIQEVEEKLEEAKLRLSEAAASSGGNTAPAAGAGEGDVSEQAAALAQSMGDAMTQSAEMEAAQAEIDMLNEQLLTLQQQLLEAMGQGGGKAAMGTAGIGGEGTGERGGIGERISVG